MSSTHFSLALSVPPEDIVVVSQTLCSITISWQPVDCAYQWVSQDIEVKYWKMGSGEDSEIMLELNGTNYTIEDLQSATTYVIQVAAKNADDVGVYGNITASTLLCTFITFNSFIHFTFCVQLNLMCSHLPLG